MATSKPQDKMIIDTEEIVIQNEYKPNSAIVKLRERIGSIKKEVLLPKKALSMYRLKDLIGNLEILLLILFMRVSLRNKGSSISRIN